MHPSALEFGSLFFEKYHKKQAGAIIVDIGSQDVNGSLRDIIPNESKYIGVDFIAGKNVDIVLKDPYQLPFQDNSIDYVVCSSVFEHSQFFWITFLEILRILKPEGLFYLNVPSNGYVHRYPVDCWRFYPDSGLALVAWGERNGLKPALLESFVGEKNCLSIENDAWNDFVAVFVKDKKHQDFHKNRLTHSLNNYSNAYCDDNLVEPKVSLFTDDFLLIKEKNLEVQNLNQNLLTRDKEIAKLHHASAKSAEKVAEYERVISELRQTLKNLQLNANLLRDSIEKVHSSTSWRITAPLRSIKARFLR